MKGKKESKGRRIRTVKKSRRINVRNLRSTGGNYGL